jgi:hypothetical protein
MDARRHNFEDTSLRVLCSIHRLSDFPSVEGIRTVGSCQWYPDPLFVKVVKLNWSYPFDPTSASSEPNFRLTFAWAPSVSQPTAVAQAFSPCYPHHFALYLIRILLVYQVFLVITAHSRWLR